MNFEDMNFEDQLRGALRHEPPPPRLAAKILTATATPRSSRVPLAIGLAAGLAILAALPPAVTEYRYRRALEARDQVQQALAITRVQLQTVQARLARTSIHVHKSPPEGNQ